MLFMLINLTKNAQEVKMLKKGVKILCAGYRQKMLKICVKFLCTGGYAEARVRKNEAGLASLLFLSTGRAKKIENKANETRKKFS